MAEISIWTPLLYFGALLSALIVFSRVYRQRRAERAAKAVHLYPRNFPKEIFMSLKEQNDSGDVKVPPKLLNAAVLAWAAEDVGRVFKIKNTEQSVTALHQQGAVGDEFFERFVGSKKFTELELGEVASAAQSVTPGWAHCLQTAMEVTQQAAVHKRLDQIDALRQEYVAMMGRPQVDGSTEKPVESTVKNENPKSEKTLN